MIRWSRWSCLSILFLSYVLSSNMHLSFCILGLKFLLMMLWILQDAHVLVQGHALPVILQGPDITHGKLRCCIYVSFSLGSSGEFSLWNIIWIFFFFFICLFTRSYSPAPKSRHDNYLSPKRRQRGYTRSPRDDSREHIQDEDHRINSPSYSDADRNGDANGHEE